MHLDVTVDATKAVGSRCSPKRRAATIGAVGVGKGGSSPNVAAPFPNPPGGLVQKDNLITFAFSFFFELGTPHMTWRLPQAM